MPPLVIEPPADPSFTLQITVPTPATAAEKVCTELIGVLTVVGLIVTAVVDGATVKETLFEGPPPGVGLVTTTG
jgi:energy-converting hydrogenase Eha subunit A